MGKNYEFAFSIKSTTLSHIQIVQLYVNGYEETFTEQFCQHLTAIYNKIYVDVGILRSKSSNICQIITNKQRKSVFFIKHCVTSTKK